MTILALVVAPACTPLRAAKVCSRAFASAEEDAPCRLMNIALGSVTRVNSARGCGEPEPPVAELNSTKNMNAAERSFRRVWRGTRHSIAKDFFRVTAVSSSLFRLYKFSSKLFFFIPHKYPSDLRISF